MRQNLFRKLPKLGVKCQAVAVLLVCPAHLQLCKSPRRTSQSKFLSIHAPSCLQAGTESGLEINASVNGFTPPLRFPTRDQTAPSSTSLVATGQQKKKTNKNNKSDCSAPL